MSAVASGQNVSSNLLEKTRIAVATAANSATEAGTMRDMAIIALRNVMAAENDANEAFLLAVKSGDKKKLTAARKVLDKMSDSAEEARGCLETITDYLRDACSAADSARELEKTIQSSQSQREALSVFAKIERYAKTASKNAEKAKDIAEALKKQWLLPITSSNPSIQPGR